jgi:phosphate starvation-inducible PhoH-like protein
MAKMPKDLNPVLLPINEAQRESESIFPKKDVLFFIGPAGTGKTHQAVKLAITSFLNNKCHRIILTRPTVECGEKLGFLPGDVNRKMGPWIAPVEDVLRRITTVSPQEIIKTMEIVPLAMIRGRTFDDCVAILDEAQKLIICGDPDQSDLRNNNALARFAKSLEELDCIGYVTFTDGMIVRHPSLASIMDALKKAESKGKG